MNYRFEIDDWLPRFPLQERGGHFSAEIITGPGQLCHNEQLRAGMQEEFNWGKPVAVDIFVMADGEPERPNVTKIGGCPYRPKSLPWPTKDGNLLPFLGQFNFSDSSDLTGSLPGDLLLIFGEYSNGWVEHLHFEWQPLNLDQALSLSDMPPSFTHFKPCHGHLFRTTSFPEAARKDTATKYPKCSGKDVWGWFRLLQYQATLIGGAPFFIQHKARGRPLCTLSSVSPSAHSPYPLLNRQEPLLPPDKWILDHDYLMMGDVGCIYISLGKNEELLWDFQCF